ncbi:DUF262 domain-containing protein [Christensenellaceae bacterium OttesenSCG-928-L17]|nr:DUF262 domain-containing protein [Christensenellaceae bacterium OttesenSCG-928-L17]
MSINDIEKNRISAHDSDIESMLQGQKFFIDYFQREYRWKDKHIKQLVDDLTTTFLKSYQDTHSRTEVAKYSNYYLGPIVFSVNGENNNKSIIDGQQRITSLTLLLIYLNRRQSNLDAQVDIADLVFSERYGEKSFNMTDEDREECLKSLFETGEYEIKETDTETVINMVERYNDISESFPDEITDAVLPFFIDWLINNVIVVSISAHSDENAYMIFETMNDRGLNLTPTEMLKGYVLSKITDKERRIRIDDIWREQIKRLHGLDETADVDFFQVWFRAKYAETIRPGKAGSEDKDFELIGSRFHNWFKESHALIFNLRTSEDFYDFFDRVFPFYVDKYIKIRNLQKTYDKNIPELFYIGNWGIADSLQDAMLLAPITMEDNEAEMEIKIKSVAHYIESFTVLRSINFRKFGQSAIKYTMFNVIKTLRNVDTASIATILTQSQRDIQESFAGTREFRLHGQNKAFVKHLLARITSYIDQLGKVDRTYLSYQRPDGKPFEIEHLWADKPEYHPEIEQTEEFEKWRNNIGALILLPNGTNQSFSSDKYEVKLEYYIRENLYAQTLNENFYSKNPNAKDILSEFDFRACPHMAIEDIESRNRLVEEICEKIWSVDYYTDIQQ